VEARRYRALVLSMLQAYAPDLPAVLFGVVEAYLGEHTPGEHTPGEGGRPGARPGPLRRPPPAPEARRRGARLWRAWSYDDDRGATTTAARRRPRRDDDRGY
jgi:hypothetical protein